MSDDEKHVLCTQFKFAIGDMVYFRSAAHDSQHVPTKYCIYAQFAERCHGGVQRWYRLDGSKDVVSETVLTAKKPAYENADPSLALEEADVARRRREQNIGSWRHSIKKSEDKTESDDKPDT